jgi:hypothetical protein
MTTQTFLQKGKEHYSTLPDALRKSVDLVEKATKGGTDYESYKNSEAITRTINLSISKLEDYISANPGKPHKISKAKKNQIKQTAKAIAKEIFEPKTTRHAKPTKNSTKHIAENQVEHLPEEIKIIKRFLLFHGKVKTAQQISSLLDYLQKAIIEKRIRKTSKYSAEIEDIQRMLINAYKATSKMPEGVSSMKTSITLVKLQRFTEIVSSYEPLKSVALIKQYINLDSSKQTPDKAKSLWEKMHRFVNLESNKNDRHIDAVKFLMPHLSNYYTGETDHLKINEVALSGFLPILARYGLKAAKYGAKGVRTGARFIKPIIRHTATHVASRTVKAYNTADKKLKRYESKGLNGAESSGVMSVDAVKSMNFTKIGFTGKLKELIGDACEPTSLFIYGPGGSGKSGLALQIADFLASKNKKIEYVAGEQFNTPTFTELINKTGIKGGDNFKIVKDLNTLPIENFDVIVIDSKDSIGLKNSAEFKELRDAHPTKSWIITSQGTKAGNFTGDEKWRNEVDTLIYCENGVASTLDDKNRWGAKASIKIY